MTARPPSADRPQPVVAWPGWVWWIGKDGYLRAARGDREVRAHNFTALLNGIRKAERRQA